MNRYEKIKNIKFPKKENWEIEMNPYNKYSRFFDLLFILSATLMIILSGV